MENKIDIETVDEAFIYLNSNWSHMDVKCQENVQILMDYIEQLEQKAGIQQGL